uniref:Baseplate wedge protein n=1 Tax=Myoviridae sp. cteBs22 TaxID=2826675 RepID=A0A8S5R105_9CAUD|nr:MAG TPA: Baseplate wedge protein [Myoviridae sp. cteBs22]
MAYYYSAAERAFFSSELMSTDAMPSDKVAVADQTYQQLMADQVAGKLIRTGSGNAPESVDQGLTAATRFGDVSFGKVTGTSLDINGNGDVSGTFVVGGAVTIKGALNAQGGLNVTSITATGTSTLAAVNATNISASGTLKVNGATTLQAVSAKKVTATELDLNGNGDVSGNLVVHGKTTLEALQANGDATIGGLLKVTGSAQLNGGGTVKAPGETVNDSSIVPASWVWSAMLRYGLGGGLNTSPSGSANEAFGSSDLNDWDKSGFYSVSFTDGQNTPTGQAAWTGVLLALMRRWEAGTSGLQIAPNGSAFWYRTRSNSAWNPWHVLATQDYVQTQVNSLTTLTDDGVKTVTNADYNTLTAPGFYHCNSAGQQNGPGGANKLLVLATANDPPKHITQVTFPIYNTGKYCPAIRYMDGEGNWSSWEKIALVESNNVLNAAGLCLTASAMIKYPGASSRSIPNFGFEVEDYVKGDDLSKAINARYLVYGKDQSGVALGALGGMIVGVEQTKKTWARLYAYRNQNGVATADYIGILANPDGTYETRSPHPVTSSDDNSIATTAWVRALFEAGLGSAIPSGVAFPYAGKTVPSGFMACNGGTISRTTYAKLFAAIGTAWGVGDGSTTFKLPDWRKRTVMGANTASEVGTYLESGAPNITGTHGGHAFKYGDRYNTEGAYYGMDAQNGGAGDGGNTNVYQMGFDASLCNPIYGSSDIIQPPAGKALWIIKT